MTPKERVHAALKRKPVDRVPVFMWYHPQTARRLGALLEVPASRVGAAMGDDVRMTWVNNNYAMEGIVHDKEGRLPGRPPMREAEIVEMLRAAL